MIIPSRLYTIFNDFEWPELETAYSEEENAVVFTTKPAHSASLVYHENIDNDFMQPIAARYSNIKIHTLRINKLKGPLWGINIEFDGDDYGRK